MERGCLLSEPGETEKAGETRRERDEQIETEEFQTGEEGTFKKTSTERRVILFPFQQAVRQFLFLAHFPDCETLSIGQPYEVTLRNSAKPTEASPPQNMVKLRPPININCLIAYL